MHPPCLQALDIPLHPLLERMGPCARGTYFGEVFFWNRKSFAHKGWKSFGFDKACDEKQNILDDVGFEMLLGWLLAIAPFGPPRFAPECSSWIFIARNGSDRSAWNPFGNQSVKRVRHANIMAKRVLQLMVVCWLKNISIFLEQPPSAVLPRWEPLEAFIHFAAQHKVYNYMGSERGAARRHCWCGSRHTWSSS